ncbi:MAG: BlaR1 peptidase [Mucilaginibacter sp.]|uniref:M56 family metallopeptidase n=1 Tax=Mucilaginibacter sp. TaxID=1882438 RepID=UPI0026126F7A|nr:M56 family metallopeptidase [Mucilaginibacter sp.]MDB5004225.1 BlaR1 peptidase [Mucilaginibacter sp.]
MNWLHYLAEANIYLGVFYLAYCLFLIKETYYIFNRVYLLLSCVLAFILPLVQLGFLKPTVYITTGTTYVPATVESFTWQDGLLYSYITGVVIFAIQFGIKLYQLQKLARLKPSYSNGDHKLVYLEGSNAAFSFFNYLFIGTETTESELITRHELVHIRQKHSADVILLELLKIINWFNPAIYLLQNSIKTVHEYIADEQTALIETDPTTYSTFLVNNAYGISGPSFTHSFFNYNLLKKRIIMLHQKRSGSLARLKYLIAVPLCAGLLCESTLGFSKTYGFVNIGGNATVIVTDTIPNKVPPPPPVPPAKGKKPQKIAADRVKFPPPIVKKDKPLKHAKFPPPIIVSDKVPVPKVGLVKFPPPVIRKDKPIGPVKFPPPVITKDNKTAAIVTDVRIDNQSSAQKTTGNEIRIEDAVVTQKKP